MVYVACAPRQAGGRWAVSGSVPVRARLPPAAAALVVCGRGRATRLFPCGSCAPRRRLRGRWPFRASVTVRRGAPADRQGERCEAEMGPRGAATPGRAGGDPAARGVVGRLNQACGRLLGRTTRTRSVLALCATSHHRAVRSVGQPAHGQGAFPRTRALRWLQTLSGPPKAQQLSLCSRNKQLAREEDKGSAAAPRWAAASARP